MSTNHQVDSNEDNGAQNSDNAASRRKSARDCIDLSWAFEFTLLLLAVAVFTGILLILKKYNDQELPDWENLGITLDALISILATVLWVITTFIAFQLLAQVKWDRISASFCPLPLLQLFENASRGVYGSVHLLPVVLLRQPVALGAAVVAILSLSIGSFTQQRQSVPNRSGSAIITIARIANDYRLMNLDPVLMRSGFQRASSLSIKTRTATIFRIGNVTWTRRVPSPEFINAARWSVANFSVLTTPQEKCDQCHVQQPCLIQGSLYSVETMSSEPGDVQTHTENWANQSIDEPAQYINVTIDDARGFLTLLRDTRNCNASDPRDKIFALLGLWKKAVEPDYTLSPQAVYTGLASTLVTNESWEVVAQLLDMATHGHSMPGLPSWVPDWSQKSQRSYQPEWKVSFHSRLFPKLRSNDDGKFWVHGQAGSLCILADEIDIMAPYLSREF
ncbi:heterokaryon incompatibility het-6 [Fusarium agapanthi]|uniref:Heterokaryon incompatibility het-6 n=1 Tax=Fusarium agapanthi TaxID=1803897 RepID=A0A9P5AXN9_9HYPO|nr:heterokaryon incompatibility het-6 [Fusarium agapanthi]